MTREHPATRTAATGTSTGPSTGTSTGTSTGRTRHWVVWTLRGAGIFIEAGFCPREAIVFLPRFMPCPQCGESVEHSAMRDHTCDRDRRVEHQLLGLREDLAAFETRMQEYLDTESGRFEVWLAARQVRASIDPR